MENAINTLKGAIGKVQDAKNVLTAEVNSGSWLDRGRSFLKDTAVGGLNLAQDSVATVQEQWNNLPGNDFIEDKVGDGLSLADSARDTARDATVSIWNRLPGNDFVEDKLGDAIDHVPFNNAFGASVRALAGQTEITLDQDGIDLVREDQAFIDHNQNLIDNEIPDLQSDPRFGREAFSVPLDTTNLQFGGDRGSLDPRDPSSIETWRVASNEITWLLRHADVTAVAHVDANGVTTIEYTVDDVLDLRPGEGRNQAYNTTTEILGTVWHDILGAEESRLTGNWTVEVE